jgi:hypothetical protein
MLPELAPSVQLIVIAPPPRVISPEPWTVKVKVLFSVPVYDALAPRAIVDVDPDALLIVSGESKLLVV